MVSANVCVHRHFHYTPSQQKKKQGRRKWAQLVNRKEADGKNWIPKRYSRVCSKHFVDGHPTTQNPYPTLHLGYNLFSTPKATRKPPTPGTTTVTTPSPQPKVTNFPGVPVKDPPDFQSILYDHTYFTQSPECASCIELCKKCRIARSRSVNWKVDHRNHWLMSNQILCTGLAWMTRRLNWIQVSQTRSLLITCTVTCSLKSGRCVIGRAPKK